LECTAAAHHEIDENSPTNLHLVQILKNVPCSFDCALEARCVDNVKLKIFLLQLSSRAMGLCNACGGKRNVHPTGEAVFNIPLTLPMANKNKSVNLQRNADQVAMEWKRLRELGAPFLLSVATSNPSLCPGVTVTVTPVSDRRRCKSRDGCQLERRAALSVARRRRSRRVTVPGGAT
jgi:hypothetical protein